MYNIGVKRKRKTKMKKFEELPKEVQEKVKEILKAYNTVSVTFENGKYHYGGYCLKNSYASDYEFIGDYKADEIFTKEERIINYVESFHTYPIDYRGKRDYRFIKNLGWDEEVTFDGNGNLIKK